MPSRIFHIVVDRMIIGGNGLEGSVMCICKCPARGAKNVTDAEVLKPSRRYNRKADRIEVTGMLGGDDFYAHV